MYIEVTKYLLQTYVQSKSTLSCIEYKILVVTFIKLLWKYIDNNGIDIQLLIKYDSDLSDKLNYTKFSVGVCKFS